MYGNKFLDRRSLGTGSGLVKGHFFPPHKTDTERTYVYTIFVIIIQQ